MLTTNILIARWLGPAGTGETAYLLWAATTITLVTGIGLPSALSRFVAEFSGSADRELPHAIAHWLARWHFILAVGATVIVTLARPFLGMSPGSAAAQYVFLACIPAYALASLYNAYLAGSQQFRRLGSVTILSTGVQITTVTIGVPYFGVAGAFGAYVAGAFVPAVLALCLIVVRKPLIELPLALRSRVRRYAVNSWAASLLSAFAWSRLEIFFLERSRSEHDVAMFSIALSMATLATQGPMLLAGALLPHFSQLSGTGQVDLLKRTYTGVTRLLGFLLFPCCFGCAAITPVLLPMMFGDAFRPAVPVAVVSIVFASIGATATAGSALLLATEKAWLITACAAVGAVLAVLSGLFVIPRWGPMGAACGRSAIQLIMVAMGVAFISRSLHCAVPFRALGRIAVASIVVSTLAFAVVATLSPPWSIAVAIPIAMLAYGALARPMNLLGLDEMARLRNLVRLVPSRLRRPVDGLLNRLDPTR
jgi:O-antigen/teichoic acid export membrane protein